MPPSVPTRDIGAIDLREIIGSQWIDINESVPDLMWPNSIQMYNRMRRDPQLTAVLRAFFLPILRATWAVDPAGCQDEVVQTVADDLGLPILGVDSTPGAARRRGVRWQEHLRLALLSLVYGHMPFERRYEIRGQRARLVNLGERMPWTIGWINLDKSGYIASVTQDVVGARPIPANRLLWYAHEREGATWTGQSVLRPAYGPWLLKHELWRVHATSIRRFGMGIPSVEAPAGATPAQVTEAQRLASAMRVGDQSGVGLPPGFKLSITGMTGSVPDALEYIRYFDQQMSTMALAGLLDLGQTATGSRALGESFLNLFLLSLQAVADEIASVATSGQPGMTGAVTDIVDLNWGEDEPAPRIVATDVGERHELTAAAISELVQYGAITPDPELDAYLRKQWRIPQQAEKTATGRSYEYDLDFGILTIDERRAQIGLPPLPDGAGNQLPEPSSARDTPPPPAPAPAPSPEQGPNPPGAAQARSRRGRAKRAGVRAAGDPAAGHRQLTTVEAASGLDPDAVQADWDTHLAELLAAWAAIQEAQRTELVTQISAAITAGTLADLGTLTVDTGPAAEMLVASMTAMATTATVRMAEEAASQGVTVAATSAQLSEDWLTAVGTAVAQIMGDSTAAAAGREALRVATPGRTGDEVGQMVQDHLESLTDTWPTEQLGGALWAAQAHGRISLLEVAPEAVYAASEVLDKNTCKPCEEIDGHEFEDLETAGAAYATGGYIDCLGRLRCRGILIAIWNEEG